MGNGCESLVVWRFSDGKAGHDNQSLGLLAALGRLCPIHSIDVPARRALRRRAPVTLPRPALLVGAGHATHAGMLAARWRRRAPAVVLMRPTLPLALFDLCVIPRHDDPPARPNVLVTDGVLNRVVARLDRDQTLALILVGGPSRHYAWDAAAVMAQLDGIIDRLPSHRIVIADSRRTPAALRPALQRRGAGRVAYRPVASAGADWLSGILPRADIIWVTEDSVSMAFEALSAGARIGLIEVPPRGPSRVRAGLEPFIAAQRMARYTAWQRGQRLPQGPPLDEAARTAAYIVGHLL